VVSQTDPNSKLSSNLPPPSSQDTLPPSSPSPVDPAISHHLLCVPPVPTFGRSRDASALRTPLFPFLSFPLRWTPHFMAFIWWTRFLGTLFQRKSVRGFFILPPISWLLTSVYHPRLGSHSHLFSFLPPVRCVLPPLAFLVPDIPSLLDWVQVRRSLFVLRFLQRPQSLSVVPQVPPSSKTQFPVTFFPPFF